MTSKNVKLFVRPKRKAIYPSVPHNADEGLGKGAGADVRTSDFDQLCICH